MKSHELYRIFPDVLREVLEELKPDPARLCEIRIRTGRPVLVVCQDREYRSKTVISTAQVGEVLAYLSDYSLYAYEDEIRQGFLSLPGGHRVGIAGRTVLEGERIRTITEVSSLNIRFAHEVKGCADRLLPWMREKGSYLHTLIVSAPGQGKTTLLRDCIRQISDGDAGYPGLTVGVVDERSEIAGSYRGVPGNDIGIRTDVLDGCPKAEGMMRLIRSMAPRVVAVDEIGGREELPALGNALNCGCVLLATVHGSSMEELRQKPVLREMIDRRMFDRYVFLRGVGQVRQILGREQETVWEPDPAGGAGC